MSLCVWIFCDVPLGTVSGVSYMVESWVRELRGQGMCTRTFVPSGRWGARSRGAASVTFRTLRHVSYRGDYHARFSSLVELRKANREPLPDVILIATPGRVGALGVTVAARYSIPVVLVVSTDTIGAAQYYSVGRAAVAMGPKPAVVLLAARQARGAFQRSAQLEAAPRRWSAEDMAARWASALNAEASEVLLLSPKSLPAYGPAGGGLAVTLFPAGVDRLPPTPPPSELRWREGALRVLYVGRFAPEKSLSLLVRALRLAVDAGADVHMVMVGEGPLREDLAEEAERLGVADRLTLLGPYERSRLQGVYASADVFAFPSVVETQAFVLNEAAHEGLPLLVADGEVNPVVCDGVSAIVVAHDAAAFAEGMSRLQDPNLRERLGAAARTRAAEVGEAAQASKLAAVLGRAVKARRRQGAAPRRLSSRLPGAVRRRVRAAGASVVRRGRGGRRAPEELAASNTMGAAVELLDL